MVKNVQPFFDQAQASAITPDKALIGNKAAHLIEMMAVGIPVPEGFVLDSTLCLSMPETGYEPGSSVAAKLAAMTRLMAESVGLEFEDETEGRPYLVSVRSGAAVSMPGMLDTVLNVGITDSNMAQLEEAIGPIAARDCYRRLIQGFAVTVWFADETKFTEVLNAAKDFYGDVTVESLDKVIELFKIIYTEETSKEFPQSVDDQLLAAVNAVYASWDSGRAEAYRAKEGIDYDTGTAVTVQGMRFGNLNNNSLTGVIFSRDPNTGENELYGDWVRNAQGEDVVGGTQNCQDISALPVSLMKPLERVASKLEIHFKDMVDIEFTVEDGALWVLQCRRGKRSSRAAVRIALDMYSDLLTREEAEAMIMEVVNQAMESEPRSRGLTFSARGKPAAGGYVEGVAVLDKEAAEFAKKNFIPYIFVAETTSPYDMPIIADAVGILTATGGKTSHAALCAREWGIAAVVACEHEDINNGDMIAIDGTTGEVWL